MERLDRPFVLLANAHEERGVIGAALVPLRITLLVPGRGEGLVRHARLRRDRRR